MISKMVQLIFYNFQGEKSVDYEHCRRKHRSIP